MFEAERERIGEIAHACERVVQPKGAVGTYPAAEAGDNLGSAKEELRTLFEKQKDIVVKTARVLDALYDRRC